MQEQIDNNTQIQPTLMGLDIGDVRHLHLIMCHRLKILRQPVLGHNDWLAAITAWVTLVPHLRSDHGQRSQASHPLLRDALPLNAQMGVSRFDAAPLIAFIAAKETNYGIETDGRILG